MKRSRALSLLVITAVSVVSAAATISAGGLETPKLVYPLNYAPVFAGKSVTFQWKAVSGATRYTVYFERAALNPSGGKVIGWGPPERGGITPGTQQAPISGVVRQSFVFHLRTGYYLEEYRWRVTALPSSTRSNWGAFTVHEFPA